MAGGGIDLAQEVANSVLELTVGLALTPVGPVREPHSPFGPTSIKTRRRLARHGLDDVEVHAVDHHPLRDAGPPIDPFDLRLFAACSHSEQPADDRWGYLGDVRATKDIGRELAEGFVLEATGKAKRADPVLPHTGGPAGNAVLTAWTGLVLLVLFLGELLTLFDVRGLISWHVAVGALLIPPAVLKTATTGWRVVGYYTGREPYRAAGPPPPVLRWLGPLVVASTLALLGSGIALILIGEQNGRRPFVSALGFGISWVTVHQGVFAVWCAAAGLHLLGRIIPAVQLTVRRGTGERVPGGVARILLLLAAAASAVVLAVVLIRADTSWHNDRFGPDRQRPPGASAPRG